jgi:hypothetical protein
MQVAFGTISLSAASKQERDKPMKLHLVALLVLGLTCGSELNVALFSRSGYSQEQLDQVSLLLNQRPRKT